MSNANSFLPPELKRSIDLLIAKLPEIQKFAEKQTARLQEVIDNCSALPGQIGLPSIPSSTTSEEEPGERQHAYAISPFCNLGQGDEKGAECTGPSALRPACHEGALGGATTEQPEAAGQPYQQLPNEIASQQPGEEKPRRNLHMSQEMLSNVEFLRPIFNICKTIPDALDEPMEGDVAPAILDRIMAHPEGPATLARLRELCPGPWKVVASQEACDLAETLFGFALFDFATGQGGKVGLHLAYSTFPFECLTSRYEAGEQSEADEFRRIFEESQKYKKQIQKYKRERQKYKKGPRTKAERTERRDELITQAIAAGISEPDQIFEFVKGQNLDLVKCGKNFINPQIMMKNYWKRQRAKDQVHQGPTQQN
jgi:hypothetical protein